LLVNCMIGRQRCLFIVWHVLRSYLLVRWSLVGILLWHLRLKLLWVHLIEFLTLILLWHRVVLCLRILLNLMLLLHHLLVLDVVSVSGLESLRVLVLVHH